VRLRAVIFIDVLIQLNSSNPDTNETQESVHISQLSFISGVELLATTVTGGRKTVLFREVSFLERCPP
jgi:hypothetical protein